MELQDLRLFRRVVQEGSISRAAAAMQVAQSAVSTRLQGLEATVGRPLLQRHRRGVMLTAEGERFLDHVERALGALDEGLEAVRAMATERVRINLAGPSSVLGYFAVPLFERLAQAGHDLTIKDAHSSDVVNRLLAGEIHAGFTLGANVQPGICQEALCRNPILAVAAPEHPLAKEGSLRLRDLQGHAIAFYTFSREFDAFQAHVAAAVEEPIHGVQRLAPVEVARSLALSGSFITFVPQMTVTAELAAGRLVRLPIEDLPAYHWEIALAYRDRKVQDPAVSLTLEAARALWGRP